MEASMKSVTHSLAIVAFAALIGGSNAGSAQATGTESSQDAQTHAPSMMTHPMPGQNPSQTPDMMQQHGAETMTMHARHAAMMGDMKLNMPGQDAFGAIQEIVIKLENDPNTDWSKVNLEALRQHLIDMNEVTLDANAVTKSIEGGLEIAVTGSGRTLAAIQALVPAHAQEINGLNGWTAHTAPMNNGVLLTVTAKDPKEVQHILGLGFIGILVSGSHHQLHHLAMAKGEFSHGH
jgi:hypothetical protein